MMILVVGGCKWGPWCPADGIAIMISGLRCLSLASCEAAKGVFGNSCSGTRFWQSAGAPAAVHFSAEPTSAEIRFPPMLPFAAARRIILPIRLCRSVYMSDSALHPATMWFPPSGSPHSGQAGLRAHFCLKAILAFPRVPVRYPSTVRFTWGGSLGG